MSEVYPVCDVRESLWPISPGEQFVCMCFSSFIFEPVKVSLSVSWLGNPNLVGFWKLPHGLPNTVCSCDTAGGLECTWVSDFPETVIVCVVLVGHKAQSFFLEVC